MEGITRFSYLPPTPPKVIRLYNSPGSKRALGVLIIAFISFPDAHQEEKAFSSLALGMELAGNKTALTSVASTECSMNDAC